MFLYKDPSVILDPWWNLINLTIYYFCDFVGRSVARLSFVNKYVSIKMCYLFLIIRFAVVANYFLMTIPRPLYQDGSFVRLPIVHNDIVTVVSIITFCLLAGVTNSLCYMKY